MERYSVALRIGYQQQEGEVTLSEGETLAEGELMCSSDGWLLCYQEAEAEVEMLLLDGEVQMRRFAVGSRQVLSEVSYREQVEAPMRYEGFGYSLAFAVYPQKVVWCVEPPFVDVCLEYLLKTADSQELRHKVCIESDGCEGWQLKAQAQALLNETLGARWGFVRWADCEDTLLVTDAGRAAERQGIDSVPIREALLFKGWRVKEAEGLWRLDPPDEAFHRALRARSKPGDHTWQNGVLGELQAMCFVLLQNGAPQETALNQQARGVLRQAWKDLHGPPEQVHQSMRQMARRFAQGRRSGIFVGEYACGVLLEGYLRRAMCESLHRCGGPPPFGKGGKG
ncbi:MAG: DUF1934 domain-containing protein [Clostridia bacterium]|nr:DUF1934 domain-containing protein [Clostridia bacterium]